jgi:hypothetical protein
VLACWRRGDASLAAEPLTLCIVAKALLHVCTECICLLFVELPDDIRTSIDIVFAPRCRSFQHAPQHLKNVFGSALQIHAMCRDQA